MTSWHDRLYFAWVHGRKLFLAYSPDGRAMMGKQRLDRWQWQQCPGGGGLSLAVSGEQLYLAWCGNDGYINILTDPETPHSVPAPLEEARSHCGPALCSHQGSLALAWLGTDLNINILTGNILTDPETPHSAPVRLEEASTRFEPALCSHQGSLVLAWHGDRGHINILADPQSPHGAPVRLEEARSLFEPALCSHQGSLVLAWCGTDSHLNLARLQEPLA